MKLGRHLRELWRTRFGVPVALLLAVLAALWSIGTIHLFPPSLKKRPLEIAAASTRVLVDTPKSSMLDLGNATGDLDAMTNRSLLVANVMASAPVREYIGRRAHVPARVLQVSSPVTRDFPRQLAQSGNEKHVSDILASPNQYRLSLRANPTVPMIEVYAQAPTLKAAVELANGAVTGMRDYLDDLGAQQGVPPAKRVHLEQLGDAHGGVVNKGVSLSLAILLFVLVFAAASAAALFVARVRRGWQLERVSERAAGPAAVGSS